LSCVLHVPIQQVQAITATADREGHKGVRQVHKVERVRIALDI
jgi:hypothetical protein